MNNLPITFKRCAGSILLTNSHTKFFLTGNMRNLRENKYCPLITQINKDYDKNQLEILRQPEISHYYHN